MTATLKVRTLVVLAGALSACRSSQAPRPGAPAAPPDLVRPYVGQTLLLRHRGDEKKWTVDRKAVDKQSGTCDVAVFVRDASFEKGAAQFLLEYLGEPRTEKWRSKCRKPVHAITLRVTGFGGDAREAAVRAAVGRVLATPEAWLSARGQRFDFPAGTGEPKVIADRSTVGAEAEMRVAREVTRWPRRVLWIEPAYADPGKIKHEGEVALDAVAGADGRLYRAKVTTPLDDRHEKFVMRGFPLWRFDPARWKDGPVAARVTERTVFHIY
jgi:hypothetical protein